MTHANDNAAKDGHSDLEQLRQEIAALQNQLIVAQRSATLGELVGTTTHEFNNVLMTIMNYAKLGLRNRDDASREKALSKILQASERAAKITHSVLGMARNRKNDFEPTQLVEILNETLFLLERELQRYRVQVELQLEPAPEVPIIGNQIQQVLLNLIINARQAMPDGGRLIIKLKHDPDSGTVDLTVRDYGVGIPEDKLPKIFDAYYSTKSGPDATGKGGTGLGLSACRSIIQAHQGIIRVESAVGRGSSFSIKLPVRRSIPLNDLAAPTVGAPTVGAPTVGAPIPTTT